MSKPSSYLDWEKSFQKKNSQEIRKSESQINLKTNSIGISVLLYNRFLTRWKEENL